MEDPNTISGDKALCFGAGKLVSDIPLGGAVVGFICSRSEAAKNYVAYRKMLLQELGTGRPNNEQMLYFAGKLIQTASFGAQRGNFRWYYIDGKRSGPLESIDKVRLAKLPDNPDKIMYGFWG